MMEEKKENTKENNFELKNINSWESPLGTDNVRFLLTEKIDKDKKKRKKYYYKIEMEFINEKGEVMRDSIDMTPDNALEMSVYMMLCL